MIDSTHATDSRDDGWVVVWTESRAEKKVASRIAAQGIDPWLPSVTERHRWSDRWRDVELPLFPCYLFARCAASRLHQLLRTPGVLTVVKAGTKPARLSDAFVATLRATLERSGVAATPVSEEAKYVVDDEVVVQEGPLAGLRGVVRQLRGSSQLVIWVHHIGRGVAFTIGSTFVARRVAHELA